MVENEGVHFALRSKGALKIVEPFEKKVWLSTPTMHGEELRYITEAYESNWMSTVGENINEVERMTCEKVGCKYAVALSAGTAALHLCVKLAGVKPGDKVFCSDMTFGATVNPVVYEGGKPIFIDTECDTWNMDPVALEKAFELYPEVKVVVLVHLYGTPASWYICMVHPLKWIRFVPFVTNMARCSLKMLLSRLALHIKGSRQGPLGAIVLFHLMEIRLLLVLRVACYLPTMSMPPIRLASGPLRAVRMPRGTSMRSLGITTA